MGVIGLTTFIDKNTHLLHKHELRDCHVVVDGNNLYHHIYRACHVVARFGGDYDVYRQQLLINFKSLLKCGIKPYVVLDGGYTRDNKKFKKCIERAKDRIRNAHIAKVKGECRMLPLLAYDTFIQTLEELDIPHVTCQYEADCEIAKLANKLKCPVISNDSDFFIFDLTHGFLPLDYLDFNPLYKRNSDGSKSSPFLHCQLYNIEGFIDSFEGLNRSMLPVFATLLGNDYAPPMAFQKIDETIHLPRKKRVHLSPRVSRIMKVIHWLTSHNSNNLVDNIRPFIKAQKKFFSSVEGYLDIDTFEGSDLFQYFSRNESFTPVAAPTFAGYNGSAFPPWFLWSICKGQITPAILNAAVLHRTIFLTQVEELSLPTIYQCSEKIRKVIYGILMTSDPVNNRENARDVLYEREESFSALSQLLQSEMETLKTDMVPSNKSDLKMNGENDRIKLFGTIDGNKSQLSQAVGFDSCDSTKDDTHLEMDLDKDSDIKVISDIDDDLPAQPNVKKQTKFEEYHRESRHLKKTYTDPILCVGCEQLPTLSQIGDFDREKRLSLLLCLLDVHSSLLKAFSPDLSLFAISLLTWMRNANPPLTEYHLDCAILCPILLHMMNSIKPQDGKSKTNETEGDEKESCDCIDLTRICHQVKTANKSKFYTVRNNLDKYRTLRPIFNQRKGILLKCDVVHAFEQLQSCIYDISNLNKLLRFPLRNTQPAFVINGSFMYNFYTDLVTRPVPSHFLEAMILKGSDLHKVFLRIKSVILETVGSASYFITPIVNKINKPRKKNRGKGKSISKKEIEMVLCCNDESSEGEVTTLEGFSVQNKFSLLTVKAA